MIHVNKFIRTYQSLIISGFILVGVAAGIFLGIVPAVKQIINFREKIVLLKKQTNVLRTKVNTLDAIDEITYKKYFDDLVIAVPSDKSITSIFTTIDGLGAQTGVLLSDFMLKGPGSIASGSAKVGNNFLPFTLSVAGSLEQIHNFLEQVIHVRRFFRVRDFDLSFFPNNNVTVRMGMDAFYAPFPTKLGSTDQPIDPLSPQDEQTITAVGNLPILGQGATPPESETGQSLKEDPFAP